MRDASDGLSFRLKKFLVHCWKLQIRIFSPSPETALNAVYVLDPSVPKEAVSLAQHKAAAELHSFHGFHVKHTGEKEQSTNRNNRSHKFSCATAWRGIIIVGNCRTMWAFEFVVFRDINPLIRSRLALLPRAQWNSGPRTNEKTIFLKVIKFYDFFMCFCRCWGWLSLAYDMLLSSLFHRLTFLFDCMCTSLTGGSAERVAEIVLPLTLRALWRRVLLYQTKGAI